MQKSPAIIEIAEENETFKSGVYFFLFDTFVYGMLTIGGGFSRSTVQAFVETYHPVSQSAGRLQDRTVATELGQVQHIPVSFVVTLTLPRNPTLTRIQFSGIPWKLVATSPQ